MGIYREPSGNDSIRFRQHVLSTVSLWDYSPRNSLRVPESIVTQKARRSIINVYSALSLFVFWIFADNPDASFSFNDFAFFANWFYGCSYFHRYLSFRKSPFAIVAYNFFYCKNYLSLQIILPFVRSYGDNSRVTLSPGRIRM